MYSKFGKLLAERFQILNHREEILSGKIKKIKPTPAFSSNLKIGSIDFREPNQVENQSNYITEESQYKPQQQSRSPNKKKSKNSVAFISQSRNEYYKSTDKKNAAPPCGQYDCKYSLVYKSVCVPSLRPRQKTKTRVSHKRILSNKNEKSEAKLRKSTSKEPFEKQLSRPCITKMSREVNERRFLKFDDMNETCSKYKRASTPNMSKSTERGPLFKIKKAGPDYNPNFNLVMPDLGKVTSFDKYSSRRDENASCRDDGRTYKPSYFLVDKRVPSPDFKKNTSRPTSATPLPSYMKSVNWRAAIDLMNEKSLEMNNYFEKDSFSGFFDN